MNISKIIISLHLCTLNSAISIKNSKISKYMFPIKYNSINHNLVISNEILDTKKNLEIFDIQQYIHADYIDIKHTLSQNIVQTITSSLLPLDSLAPTILKLNEYFIKTILDNEFLSLAEKKILILNSIQFAINGDLLGSQILELYYDIVNKIL